MKKISHNWRSFPRDNLKGLMLEIGALHAPFLVNDETKVMYQDLRSTEDLKLLFKNDEKVIKDNIVKVDIVSPAEVVPVPDEYFDAVLNSHVLEHLANPVKAILDWLRVIKTGGYLFMVVPIKDKTFDRHRTLTTLRHLVNDFSSDVNHVSLDHYVEYYTFVEGHNVKQADDAFVAQRNIHVHTFTPESLIQLLNVFSQGNYIIEDTLISGISTCVLIRKI